MKRKYFYLLLALSILPLSSCQTGGVKKYSVSVDNTKCSYASSSSEASSDSDYDLTFTPDFGYKMSIESFAVTIGENTYSTQSSNTWTYNESSNKLTISKKIINNSISVTAKAEMSSFTLTYSKGNNYSFHPSLISGSKISLGDSSDFTVTLSAEEHYTVPSFSDITITTSDTRFDKSQVTYKSTEAGSYEFIIPKSQFGCDIDIKFGDAELEKFEVKSTLGEGLSIPVGNISYKKSYSTYLSIKDSYKYYKKLPESITITMGDITFVEGNQYEYDPSTGEIFINEGIVIEPILITANPLYINREASISESEGITNIQATKTGITCEKDYVMTFDVTKSIYKAKVNLTIDNNDNPIFSLIKNGDTYTLTIQKASITGNIHITIKATCEIIISETNITLLPYQSKTISYQCSEDVLSAESSDASKLDVSLDAINTCFTVTSKGNYSGTYNVTLKNSVDSCVVPITVNFPTNATEAAESFGYALIKNVSPFDLTFNYNNSEVFESESTLDIDGFIYHIEIADSYSISPIEYSTGSNKTNKFSFNKDNFAYTKTSLKDTEYYYENLLNPAYLLRKSETVRTTLPIDSVKQTLTVSDSHELFFALEHGYRPVCVAGSKAEENYNVARKICLNSIGLNDSMDDFTKMRQIYDYLFSITHYDHWMTESDKTTSPWTQYTSYFADGVLLNDGVAVCDGFSKAYTILCGLECLPVIRGGGYIHRTIKSPLKDTKTYPDINVSFSGHAWNYGKIDGKWYLICPTWSKNDLPASTSKYKTCYNYNHSFESYEPFLTTMNYFEEATYSSYESFLVWKNKNYNDVYEYYEGELESKYSGNDLKYWTNYYTEYYFYYNNPLCDFSHDYFPDVEKQTAPLYSLSKLLSLDTFKYNGTTYDFYVNSSDEMTAIFKKCESISSSLSSDFTLSIGVDTTDSSTINSYIKAACSSCSTLSSKYIAYYANSSIDSHLYLMFNKL